MGAVLVKGTHPISVGYNKLKFNRRWSNQWAKSIHAECEALRQCGKDRIKNSTIYVYREYHDGTPALARPCGHCMQMLKTFGVKTVIYSTNVYPFWSREEI